MRRGTGLDLLYIPCLLVLVTCQLVTPGYLDVSSPAGQLHTLTLDPRTFDWREEEVGHPSIYRYRSSMKGEGALPDWLNYLFSERYRRGVLFGVPKYPGVQEIQVVGTNKQTFNTGKLHIFYSIKPPQTKPLHFVRIKIVNINLDDALLNLNLQERLLNLFKESLWINAHSDLRITFAESAISLGSRRPVLASARDGVVLELGSASPHSTRLLELERETTPLRRQASCSYKRTSEEREFHSAGFSVDWCAFRIHSSSGADQPATRTPPSEGEEERREFVDRSSVQKSESKLLSFLWLSVSLVLTIIFICLLSILIWRNNSSDSFVSSLFTIIEDSFTVSKVSGSSTSADRVQQRTAAAADSRRPSSVDLRAARASSVQRQTDTLRSLGRRRDVTPRLQTSPDTSSIVSGSRTASPCPSLEQPGEYSENFRRSNLSWTDFIDASRRPQPPPFHSKPSEHSSNREESTTSTSQ